ncbi:MAG: sulfite oxidase [Gammaproteobacteria bacterium]|nr:sulfite oxidase [Gammaproteobacteria bacterium]MCY4340894.1 sulfite oxidase [Gammaproteobacteria bacterium]
MNFTQRRRFLKGAGMAAAGAVAGGALPFGRWSRHGFISEASAQPLPLEDKEGLVVLGDRPLTAETPAHLLDDEVTPVARHFIRNNGIVPADMSPDSWTLTIDGLVERPMTLSIEELRQRFEVVSHRLVIECGGNGRAGFDPPARGNQWTYGAVGCSEWTGVRLADVLEAAGVKETAIYTAHEGADLHLSGTPGKLPISRGVPLRKAMDPYNLIAFEMNGGPLHPMNGAPLRLVIPGWPGSCSQKWLTRIRLRDMVHDGPKMTGSSYRVPPHPVAPGEFVAEEDMRIIHAMPVKSLITRPRAGLSIDSRELEVAGHAWAGDTEVVRVDVSADYGATWQAAELAPPRNPHAWQRFSANVRFSAPGYYQVWARATDSNGISQPFTPPWNPKGYLNNALHQVSVRVG